MQYVIKSLAELAQALNLRALNAEQWLQQNPRSPALRRAEVHAERNAYIEAARVVDATVFSNPPIEQEYALEYAAAQDFAAWQIWASIQRHAGDPRWEYHSGRHDIDGNYERRT